MVWLFQSVSQLGNNFAVIMCKTYAEQSIAMKVERSNPTIAEQAFERRAASDDF
jgi:hypothetical protein